ncbi:MAG: CsgG/HfaB family protein [Patescibacteria group bacterium]
MKLKKITVFLLVIGLFFGLSSQVTASSIAIAEFETDSDFREFRDDLNNKYLDYVITHFDRDVFQVKERLRRIDLLRERSLSRNDRKSLRRNLGADFLILPRLVDLKVEEVKTLSISVFSDEKKSHKINIGVNKVAVEIEVNARVVDLRSGNIKTGFNVKKEETFSIGRVRINRKNVFSEKMTDIADDVINPAVEELSLITISEIEDLTIENEKENARIVEIAPYNIEQFLIAKVIRDSSRFRIGREITIYKSGSEGGRVPVAEGHIIDEDGDYITIELYLETKKVRLEENDSIQVNF